MKYLENGRYVFTFIAASCIRDRKTFHSTAVDVDTVQKIMLWTSRSPLVGRGQKSANTILAYLRQGTAVE
jgi:hypothetical protein